VPLQFAFEVPLFAIPLSKAYPTTPAMACGKADHVRSLEEIAGLLEPRPVAAEA